MRSFVKLLIFFAVTFLFLSCEKENKNEFVVRFTPPPAVDRSTPDRLVKSTWAHLIWTNSLANNPVFNAPYLTEKTKKANDLFMSKGLERAIKEIERYEILKVNAETESRATVLTQEGKDTAFYILTNPGDGWLIEDKKEKCMMCSGSGKEIDLEVLKREYTHVTKECRWCQGVGKISIYYKKDRS